MATTIAEYNEGLDPISKAMAEKLERLIRAGLPEAESKIWHAHPVWFLEGNPIVGYSKRKQGTVLMFWSGDSFDEPKLKNNGSFKAGEIKYFDASEIDDADVFRWVSKSREIQWDYKNIIKRKGELVRIE